LRVPDLADGAEVAGVGREVVGVEKEVAVLWSATDGL
jgi:hypothetical protein